MKVVVAIGIVVASFFVTLWAMDYFISTCPGGEAVAMTRPFEKSGRLSVYGKAPSLADISDLPDAPTRSRAVVCEGNFVLGPAHSQHGDIAEKGGGRFSHWGPGFVFSASDNSDPNKNGRTYWAVRPR
jgi:hypothetical protein